MRQRRLILTVSCIGMMTICFATSAPAMCVTAIAEELSMDKAWQGFFLSAPFWGLSVAILAAGPLADRIGFRFLLLAAAALQSAGLAVISQAHGPAMVWLGGFVLGMGTGVADALLTPMTCALFPRRRAQMTNLLHSFYAIGLVANVLLILLLARLGWSWHGVFLLLSGLVLPYGLVMALLALPSQSHEGRQRLPARQIVRTAAFAMLLLSIFLAGLTEIGPSSWLPGYIEQAIGGTRFEGGMGLLLFGVAMALGRLSNSALVNRLGPRRLFIIGGAICAGCLLLAALPLGQGRLAALWPVVWLTVLGLGVAGFWPTIMGCAGDRYPAAGASMFSLLSAAGNFGGVVGPHSIGLLGQSIGLRLGMAILAAAPALLVMTMVKLLRKPVGLPKQSTDSPD